jgi:beta-glucosidase
MTFPEKFVWGVATAAYQIEGAPYRAGGGATVWDMFCRRPQVVHDQENGDVACDHYHRYREDVALMKDLGTQAYRFSISWPRVLPEGTGQVHTAGLDFYDRLVDELLRANVVPYVTLFHWDFPYELYCRGGWLNRDSSDWFADYARIVTERLSDRVQHWMTINEPQCIIELGHHTGRHAPGDKLHLDEVLRAGHHLLLAHGKAVQAIRAHAVRAPLVGYAPVGSVRVPASDDPRDIAAARTSMFTSKATDLWMNTWWMDPVFLGHYPEDGLRQFGSAAPAVRSGDMETIRQPLDFFGCNIYNGQTVRAGDDDQPVLVGHEMGLGRTSPGWPVTPKCLYWGPRFFYERYGKPIFVTENGLGNNDWVALDGKVHDPQRIDFLGRYLREFARAGRDGTEIGGYFQWSLMDNFEWQEGYKIRFGLVYVDYQTQKRIPKDSAYWYRDVMRSNGASLYENQP